MKDNYNINKVGSLQMKATYWVKVRRLSKMFDRSVNAYFKFLIDREWKRVFGTREVTPKELQQEMVNGKQK